jgi:hypothetical protein
MTKRFMTSVVLLWLSAFLGVNPAFSGAITVQLSSEPTQFDPLLLEDAAGLKISANTIGTLYEYDGRGERQKGLLDNYSISRDRLHYTFRFKKGLKWSDGKPFHAEQFLLTLQRLSNESIRAALSELFPKVDLKKTKVTDARTIEVYLREADAQLLNWLTLPPFAPIRQDMVDRYTKNRSPVVPTLGAYEIVDYKRESHLDLKKNANYYAADKVSIEEVKVRFVGEEATLLPLLKSGAIDILNKVPVLQVEDIAEISTIKEVPVEAVTYLAFNSKKAPFNEKKNRIAVRDVLTFGKRKELAKLLKTAELPAPSFVPTILAPAGYKREATNPASKSEEKLKFSIQSDSGSRNQTILEYVQNEIKDELGWKPELDMVDWKTHYSKLKSDPDSIYRFGWQNPVSDPFLVYQILTSKSPNNFTGWSNTEYDELVEELRQENRQVKKSKLIHELEAILWDEAPVVPLLHQVLRFAYSKRVLGFRANPFGVILFRELHLNENLKK